MNKDKINVCVIGSGRAGMIHARNFAGGIRNSTLVALAEPRREVVEKSCKELEVGKFYLSYEEAMVDESIDAVIVVTPTVFHKEIVVAAARAGKHILCEKPMAMNIDECAAMTAAADEHGVKLQIGFMRRFDESFVAAKEQIDRGEIGDVVLVKSLTRGPSVPQKWQYDIRASNGPLAEVNSHDIDTLRWFTNSEFKEVYAIAGNYRCREAQADFPDFYDNVVMVASFENGMQGFIDGAVSVGYGYDARVEIVGTKGVIFVGRLHQQTTVTCAAEKGIARPFVKSWRDLFLDAYRSEDQEFIQSILEDRPPAVGGFDGKMAVAVVNAGNRSIVEKRPVRL